MCRRRMGGGMKKIREKDFYARMIMKRYENKELDCKQPSKEKETSKR